MAQTTCVVLNKGQLAQLLEQLKSQEFQLVGPQVRDQAIVYDKLTGIQDLPQGWTEIQEAGKYHLKRSKDLKLFGFSHGPESMKRSFFQPLVPLFKARKKDGTFTVMKEPTSPVRRLAWIGVRACDLAAVQVQDQVLLQGNCHDPHYKQQRDRSQFVIAINCTQAGGTCFCASMGTGPQATHSFDLALTELLDDQGHRFVTTVGSPQGQEMMDLLAASPASESDVFQAKAAVEHTAQTMGRTLDTTGIHQLLFANQEHPHWQRIADRCLSCANCTMVCPTCFCTTIEDSMDLAEEHATRTQVWDSCFTSDHSYVHGGSVRNSTAARYRQWLTHKFASWIDQFGTSGCVGCGRCISWCPVGIDITQEIVAIRSSSQG
jgi:sulfhydrogenase subunit beta (sulfur reductase)